MRTQARKIGKKRMDFARCVVCPECSRARRWVVTICIAAAVSMLATTAHSEDENSLIDKALSQSGIVTQLESLPTAVLMAVPGDVFPDTKTKEAVTAALKKSAGKEVLIVPVREAIRRDYRPQLLEKVIEFYDSKTGRKVARLEGRGLAPDLLKTIREGRKTAVSLEEARLNLLRRLIRADNIGGSNSDLVAAIVKGLLHGPSVELGDHQPPALEGLETMGGDIKVDSSRTEELALVGFAHTFRSLDDKELEEFANFKESAAGVWFGKRVLKGLREAVFLVGAGLGEAIQKGKNP